MEYKKHGDEHREIWKRPTHTNTDRTHPAMQTKSPTFLGADSGREDRVKSDEVKRIL